MGSNPSLSADFLGFPGDNDAAQGAPFASRSTSADGAEVVAPESHRRPRVRILPNGWIRHDGCGMLRCLAGVPVKTIRLGGNAQALDGLIAEVHSGWVHTGFSSDIIYWRAA